MSDLPIPFERMNHGRESKLITDKLNKHEFWPKTTIASLFYEQPFSFSASSYATSSAAAPASSKRGNLSSWARPTYCPYMSDS